MKLNYPIKGIGKTQGIYFTQFFGQKLLDYSQFSLVGHNGIDIACPKGTPILAMADGWIVEQTDKPTGYGNRISQRVDEGDTQYLITYGHFDRFIDNLQIQWDFYDKRRPVKQGEVIGFADSTGFSQGHHLHFSLYIYKNFIKQNDDNGYKGAIDPMPFMKIRVPKWVGYKYSKQKDFYLPLPDMDTYQKILTGELKLTDIYDFEDFEVASGLNYPPKLI